MTFGPVLLRVLLCLSLILNGSGYAMAAAHVEGDTADPVAVSTPTDTGQVAAAEQPCHGPANAGASEQSTQGSDSQHDHAATSSGEASDDCCKNGACRCGCVHQTQVAAPGFFPDSAVLVLPPPRGPQNRYPEPAPPHLMRPPIA